ncbi:MAG: SAM-dependent DNA methyltransferase [Actinomyces sp.]|nr:SAM-dependent DNA methyltransferase [Actinomyces sp.]
MDSQVVSRAIEALRAPERSLAQLNWKRALAGSLSLKRPDLARQLIGHLGVDPSEVSPLAEMSVGELGVVYEALLALSDPKSRRRDGQYFTPDDVAKFMVAEAGHFPAGTWLDPCCGIGNLSWHLAASQHDPSGFVERRLSLVDLDEVALASAEAILAASFAEQGNHGVLPALVARSQKGDFLSSQITVTADYVIMNPPYGRKERQDGYATARAGELYAYFMEKVSASTKGFVSVTPASYLGGLRYAPLRNILSNRSGRIYVFDNVPDTIFRGYKYGSTNTSTTNFVRACITVADPQVAGSVSAGPASGLVPQSAGIPGWLITPIIRWTRANRKAMWEGLRGFLVPLRRAPGGEWAKVMPGTAAVWDALCGPEGWDALCGPTVPAQPGSEDSDANARCLANLLVVRSAEDGASPFRLWVASTPRYYVSASRKPLQRSSCHVLTFQSGEAMNQAYLLLNSSLAYWWWRCVDGGITLQKRTLASLPLPPLLGEVSAGRPDLLAELESSDSRDIQLKLNAGRINENVKRPRDLVEEIDRSLLAGLDYDFARVFVSDLFAQGSPTPALPASGK